MTDNVVFKNKKSSVQESGNLTIYAGLQNPITLYTTEELKQLEESIKIALKIKFQKKRGMRIHPFIFKK